MLQGGDRRSIGASAQVVDRVLADARLFTIVFEGMTQDDPLVRMRCADAVEKIARRHPEYLAPYKRRLLALADKAQQPEMRWHLAQLLGRIQLTKAQRRPVVDTLNVYLADTSRIVKTFAMQTLAEIAERDRDLRGAIVQRLETLTRTGSPAMRSRGNKLLARPALRGAGASESRPEQPRFDS